MRKNHQRKSLICGRKRRGAGPEVRRRCWTSRRIGVSQQSLEAKDHRRNAYCHNNACSYPLPHAASEPAQKNPSLNASADRRKIRIFPNCPSARWRRRHLKPAHHKGSTDFIVQGASPNYKIHQSKQEPRTAFSADIAGHAMTLENKLTRT